MTVIPASSLSRADLARLGNNVLGQVLRDREDPDDLSAVNRSLAACDEAVDDLVLPGLPRPADTIAGVAGCVC